MRCLIWAFGARKRPEDAFSNGAFQKVGFFYLGVLCDRRFIKYNHFRWAQKKGRRSFRYINEPQRHETYRRTCAPREDSDQTALLRSLIRIFAGRTLDIQRCKVSSCGQRTLCSGCASCACLFESSSGAHVRWYVFARFGSFDLFENVN